MHVQEEVGVTLVTKDGSPTERSLMISKYIKNDFHCSVRELRVRETRKLE